MIVSVGAIFGRWTVVRLVQAQRRQHFLCRCQCGAEKVIAVDQLTGGKTKSCGCLRRDTTRDRSTKHGHAPAGRASRTYRSWCHMIERCTNSDATDWKHYGGKGIKVCDRWLKFENFLADMGEAPPGLTIERDDNDSNYEPTNCRWATRREQSWNRSIVRWVDVDGERLPLSVAAARLRVGRKTLRKRLAAA